MADPHHDTSHGLASIVLQAILDAGHPLDEPALAKRARLTPMAVRSGLRALVARDVVARDADGAWHVPRRPCQAC